MIYYIFFHGSLVDLKKQTPKLLPEENFREWKFFGGWWCCHLNGFNILFKEKHHTVGVRFGGNSVPNARGMDKAKLDKKLNE